MNDVSLNSVVVRSNEVVANTVGNELVMMDIESGSYFALDPIGTDIWARLAQPLRVDELCRQLMQAYTVDATTCETDVLDILNDMAQAGIVVGT